MMLTRVLVAITVVAVALLLFGLSKPGKSQPLPTSAVASMDWLRGLSAVAVLVGHARGLFLQDFAELQHRTPVWKLFYFVTALGHEAVIVFFILSGFLVGSTVLSQVADQRLRLRAYLSRRLTRLYVVLIPGLLLTALWDAVGLHFFGAQSIYGGIINARHLALPDVTITHSWGHFLGNLAFLQHLFIQPYGSNGPLWSLPYEFWAYLLFPLLVQAGRGETPTTRRIGYAGLSCALLIAGGWKLGLYLAIWLLGAALALWWRHARVTSSRWLVLALWAGFGGALVLSTGKLHSTVKDIALALATTALLGGILARRSETGGSSVAKSAARAAAVLAGFSYTLYVAHYPLLTLLFAALMKRDRWAASLQSVVAVLAIALGIAGYAFLVSRVTEAHTDRIRARLSL